MVLTINSQILERLRAEGFFPDTMITALFILKSLRENNLKILDDLDDYNTSKRVILIYMELIRKGMLEEDTEGHLLYKITDKGIDFLSEIQAIINIDQPIEEPAGVVVLNPAGKPQLEDWFDSWMDLWPSGIKNQGGKYLKSDKADCMEKMAKFMKKHPEYSYKQIRRATRDYLDGHAPKGYLYARAAVYFIDHKNDGSELAACLQAMKDVQREENQSFVSNDLI